MSKKQIHQYTTQELEIRSKQNKYTSILLSLTGISFMSIYMYGEKVIYLLLTSIITAFVLDYICYKILKKEVYEFNLSFLVTAIITVLLMPATVPLFVVMTSIFISICVAKYPFGGEGHTIFNPTAVGVAFCAICWPEYVFKYPVPFTTSLGSEELIQYASSTSSILKVGGIPRVDLFDFALGNYAAPMGTSFIIVLIACLIYLIYRKVASSRILISTLSIVFIVAFLFPRAISGSKEAILHELFSGGLLFGLTFMVNDPATIPKTKDGKTLYGIFLAFFIVLFKYFGALEFEFIFALLLANIMAIPCDRYAKLLFDNIIIIDKLKFNFNKSNKKGELNA